MEIVPKEKKTAIVIDDCYVSKLHACKTHILERKYF
jgi:hypothetical protein